MTEASKFAKPMSREQMLELVNTTVDHLDGIHPIDMLQLARFLIIAAISCWGEDHRSAVAREFCDEVLARVAANG